MNDCPNCGGTHFGSNRCPFTAAPCVVCGADTVYACSDCRIETGESVYVCTRSECRDAHEKANPQHPIIIASATADSQSAVRDGVSTKSVQDKAKSEDAGI